MHYAFLCKSTYNSPFDVSCFVFVFAIIVCLFAIRTILERTQPLVAFFRWENSQKEICVECTDNLRAANGNLDDETFSAELLSLIKSFCWFFFTFISRSELRVGFINTQYKMSNNWHQSHLENLANYNKIASFENHLKKTTTTYTENGQPDVHQKWFALVAHWWFALRCVRADVRRSLCVCETENDCFRIEFHRKFHTHVSSPRCYYYCYFSRSVCHSHISIDIKMTTTKNYRTIRFQYKRKWWWCFDKKSVKQINGKRDARTTEKNESK